MDKIIFASIEQVVLYECEIKGQLSDGWWENAEPEDHWVRMCEAEIKFVEGNEQACINFQPMLEYDFCEVAEFLSDRMIGYVKTVLAFPEYIKKFDSHHSWDMKLDANEQKLIAKIKYTHDDLMNDLQEMSDIVNGVYEVTE